MINWVFGFVNRIRPDIESLEEEQRRIAIGDTITVFYAFPLAILGLIWLIRETDLGLVQVSWQLFTLLVLFFLLFDWLTFFLVYEIRPDALASSDGSLDGVVKWAGFFILGPSVLWFGVIRDLFNYVRQWQSVRARSGRWAVLRGISVNIASSTIPLLVATRFYRSWGGQTPIPNLLRETLVPAIGTVLVDFVLFGLIFSGYLSFIVWAEKQGESFSARAMAGFLVQALALPYMAYPFGILAAGVYVQNSYEGFVFFMIGLVLVAYIARQLSKAAENNRQQTRQLEKLERLSQAIIAGLPDASTLPDILSEHVPGMFTSARVVIWLDGEELIFAQPKNWEPEVDGLWVWIQEQTRAYACTPGNPFPWCKSKIAQNAVLTTPIQEVETAKVIGFIFMELRSVTQLWDQSSLTGLFPVAQSLAAQIASALHQSDIYHETLDLQRSSQELKLAGQIQASFFPDEIPNLPGWELAVTILPARETSGDFFDFIPLEDGRLGILIADVTDKGFGPALYMALSRTLIRTYAIEYEAEPDVVFFAVNERILKDARANLFVTAFYGILDPVKGTLIYCNAGHNPPYLLRQNGDEVEALQVTGMPIGLDENVVWQTETVQINVGDVLLLYTDGIPDTQNEAGVFFDDEGMLSVAQAQLGYSALEIQAGVIEEVMRFSENLPQVDDITLLVLTRNDTAYSDYTDDAENLV